jgi:Secretion system C-terminal sorting domain
MKKVTLLLMMVTGFVFAQTKTTGVVTFTNDFNATLSLNNTTSTVTLSMVGPNDRWFALQFGSFVTGGGMSAGQDVVYWNGTTLVDAVHVGIGSAPTTDATNNWTLVSNTNNSPSATQRTIVYTRPFSTGDINDYTFNFADSTIDLAFARKGTAVFTFNYHGGAPNRGYAIGTPLTTLGVEDFSLKASSIYPNPSNGTFRIQTKTALTKVNVYGQTGNFIKTIEVKDNSQDVEVNLKGVATGIYLLELQNETDKSWKKIVVE